MNSYSHTKWRKIITNGNLFKLERYVEVPIGSTIIGSMAPSTTTAATANNGVYIQVYYPTYERTRKIAKLLKIMYE
jgi:hypothetical protein